MNLVANQMTLKKVSMWPSAFFSSKTSSASILPNSSHLGIFAGFGRWGLGTVCHSTHMKPLAAIRAYAEAFLISSARRNRAFDVCPRFM